MQKGVDILQWRTYLPEDAGKWILLHYSLFRPLSLSLELSLAHLLKNPEKKKKNPPLPFLYFFFSCKPLPTPCSYSNHHFPLPPRRRRQMNPLSLLSVLASSSLQNSLLLTFWRTQRRRKKNPPLPFLCFFFSCKPLPTPCPYSDHHFLYLVSAIPSPTIPLLQPPPLLGHIQGYASHAWSFIEAGPPLVQGDASSSGWSENIHLMLLIKVIKKPSSTWFAKGVYKYDPLR